MQRFILAALALALAGCPQTRPATAHEDLCDVLRKTSQGLVAARAACNAAALALEHESKLAEAKSVARACLAGWDAGKASVLATEQGLGGCGGE